MILVLLRRSVAIAPAAMERDGNAIAFGFGSDRHIGPRRFDTRRQWMLWQAARAAGMI